MSRISLSSSCLSESPRNSSRVTSQSVYVYQTMLRCTDCLQCGTRCNRCVGCAMRDTHNATKRYTVCRDRSVLQGSPEDIGLGGLVAPCLGDCVRRNTCVDRCGVCVMSYMRFSTCVCICGHGCIGHTSTRPQSRSTECIASCSLASAIDGATSLWCVRGYIATTIYSVADAGVC